MNHWTLLTYWNRPTQKCAATVHGRTWKNRLDRTKKKNDTGITVWCWSYQTGLFHLKCLLWPGHLQRDQQKIPDESITFSNGLICFLLVFLLECSRCLSFLISRDTFKGTNRITSVLLGTNSQWITWCLILVPHSADDDVGVPAASTGLYTGELNPFMTSETLSEASTASLTFSGNWLTGWKSCCWR